jgi:hypothetical protein
MPRSVSGKANASGVFSARQAQADEQHQATERESLAGHQHAPVTQAMHQTAGGEITRDVGQRNAHDVVAHMGRPHAVAAQHQRRAAQKCVKGRCCHADQHDIQAKTRLARQLGI